MACGDRVVHTNSIRFEIAQVAFKVAQVRIKVASFSFTSVEIAQQEPQVSLAQIGFALLEP